MFNEINKQHLITLAHVKMPFGKYENRYLTDVPEAYFIWYKQKGFPQGKLGDQMREVLELKLNGLEDLVRKLRSDFPRV